LTDDNFEFCWYLISRSALTIVYVFLIVHIFYCSALCVLVGFRAFHASNDASGTKVKSVGSSSSQSLRYVTIRQGISCLVCCLFLYHPHLLFAFHLQAPSAHGAVYIRSQCRNVCPGEVIKISLEAPHFSSAWVRFLDREHLFVQGRNENTYFALAPVGLETTQGIHVGNVCILFLDGTKKKIPFKVSVGKKRFPIQRLAVKKKFISPSEKCQRRIQEEEILLRSIYAACTPKWCGNGSFIPPARGVIRQNFGERRIFNNVRRSCHKGVDIRVRKGLPVQASNSGTVAEARDLYFAGKAVIIDHGIGLFSLYCHLSKISVKKGEVVAKGQLIGRVGSTGRVTGPHLHWGVKLCNEYVDPLSLLYLPFR